MKHLDYINKTFEKSETIIMKACISLLSVFIMLRIFFIYNSENVMNVIFDSMEIKFELVNDHFFTDNNKESKSIVLSYSPATIKDYYLRAIDRLDLLSVNNIVKDFNYNITIKEYGLTHYNSDPSNEFTEYLLFGVNTDSFQMYHNLNITNGRFFTLEELNSGERKAVIPDNSYVLINGEKKKVEIGDIIRIGTFYDCGTLKKDPFYGDDYHWTVYDWNYSDEVKVIGLYEVDFHYDFSEGIGDSFVNELRILVPNKELRKIIQNMDFDVYSGLWKTFIKLGINSISFTAGSVWEYKELSEEFNKTIDNIKKDYEKLFPGDTSVVFHVKPQDYDVLMNSVNTTRVIYNTVFTFSALIIIIIFSMFIIYFQSQKDRTICIYQYLGIGKIKIIYDYLTCYLLFGLGSSIFGGVAAYGIAKKLTATMIKNAIVTKSELLNMAYSGNYYYDVTNQFSEAFSNESYVKSALIMIGIVELIITIMGLYSTRELSNRDIAVRLNEI